MKRVLVTGASGFIGFQSLPYLIARGYEIHAIAHRNLPRNEIDVRWHQADLLDSGAVRALLAKVAPSHLLHFAWYAEPGKYQQSEKNSEWSKAGIELLQAFAASGGQRAVFAGTCFEYDLSYGYCSEASTPCVPNTPYGVGKFALAGFVAGSPPTGVSTAWGRVFHLFGPGEHPKRLVPSVSLSLMRGETAHCTHARQVRDFMHVDDVASAFVALLESGVEGIVNIGSGDRVAIRTLVLQIADLLGRPDSIVFGSISPQVNDPSLLIPDISRLRDEVEWTPRLRLRDGLACTIDWWRMNRTRLRTEA